MSKNTSSMIQRPKPDSQTHSKSGRLTSDARSMSAPRFFKPIHAGDDYTVIVRLYGMLGTPGSELMTVSVLFPKMKKEYEFEFDEYFPVSIRFKKQTDQERAQYAFEQIQKSGFDELVKTVSQYLK